MRQIRFFLLSLFSISLLVRASAAECAISEKTPVRKKYRDFIELHLTPGQTRIDLAKTFLIPESDSVFVDGKLLTREVDYRINTLKGFIILVADASGGEIFRASWSRYPFSFPPVFAIRYPGEKPLDHAGTVRRRGEDDLVKKEMSPYRLRLSGSKTIGFTIGSYKGLGIDQSLKVTMAGKLAKDLEVKAFLTDDNLPVQPEGNTEELKSLDKVYVEVKSRNIEARLGDFGTGMDWSEFSSFKRELRGATVATEIGNQRFFAGGGIAKGRFKTASFRGREGVQGPYELLDARRFNGIVVLSGTETVYLDGSRLSRGSEKDYTIDYNRGTVTFTEKTVITADSEIVIDYQTGEDDYARSTVTGGWSALSAGGAVTLRTFLFQESDDPNDPLRQTVSDEEKEIIKSAGDDPEEALAPGIEEVEDGTDCYILIPADSLPMHYLFVESGGEYRLTFYRTGTGEGDYESDGFTRRGEIKYRYAGEGRGSYRIGRKLPLPERKRLFAMGVSAKKGVLFLDAEGDISEKDNNILSSEDDDDNRGGAFKAEGGIRGLKVGSSRLSLSGDYSALESRFESTDTPRAPYFYRNWNLEEEVLSGREDIAGAKIEWKGDSLWAVSGSSKRLVRKGGISAKRNDISARIGDTGFRGLEFRGFDTKTGNQKDRRYGNLSGAFGFWRIVPRFDFDTEKYRSFVPAGIDTGRYYFQNTFSIAGRKLGGFRTEISFRQRRTEKMSPSGGVWSEERENDEIRLDGGYRNNSRIIDLYLTHRVTRTISSGLEDSHDLAKVRFRDSWESMGITTDAGYKISSGENRRLEKAVIYVGENEGDYDEEGREVGQKRGDYMVLYLPGGDLEVVRSVELTWRTSVGSGFRGIGTGEGSGSFAGLIRKNLSVDHFFSVIEQSSTDDMLRLYLLDPGLLQRDGLTLYGKNSLRQEWSFLNDVKRLDIKFVFLREDEEDNRSGDFSTSRYLRETQARIESLHGKAFTISLEGGTKLRSTDSDGPGEQRYRVETFNAANVLGYKYRASTKLSFKLGFEKRSDAVSGAKQRSYTATPSVNSSVGKKVHLSAFLKLTYTDTQSDEGKPLFFLEEGMREDWMLVGQYRLTRNLSVGLNYTGRREKDYLGEVKTVHALKMECRAFF
ncbi:MAG: hypothetical protein JW746_08920 [Candidatus Krumholzibacteriota bacterium]|nr:hypothetical protein [Candidatus Krumholzibacteriota bacterium]